MVTHTGKRFPRLVRSLTVSAFFAVLLSVFAAGSAQQLVWYSTPNPGPDWEQGIRGWLADYGERTGIQVRFEVGGYAEHQNRIVIGSETGTLPDIVQMWPAFSAPLMEGGRLLVLNDFVEDLGDIFWDAAVDAASFGGNVYGIPMFADVRPFVYRADIFAELGLAPPTNWDEFLEVAAALTRDTSGDGRIDQWGYTSTFVEHRAIQSFWPFLWGFGGGFFDADMNPNFNQPSNVEALQFVVDLIYVHEVAPVAMRSTHVSEVLAGICDGRYPLSVQGGFVMAHVADFCPEHLDDIAFHLLPEPPAASGVGAFMGGQQLAISTGSQHPDAAKQLLRDFSLEYLEEFWVDTGYVPTVRPAYLEKPVFGQEPMLTLTNALGQAEPEGRPLREWPQLLELMNVAVQQALTQQLSPQEALDRAQEEAIRVLAR